MLAWSIPQGPVPTLAAAFLQQLNPGEGHAPVHGFAHVINREQGRGAGGEGFHLHAGLAVGFGLCDTHQKVF